MFSSALLLLTTFQLTVVVRWKRISQYAVHAPEPSNVKCVGDIYVKRDLTTHPTSALHALVAEELFVKREEVVGVVFTLIGLSVHKI